MAFLLTQGSSTLYKMDLSTGTATALTLPTGVTLSTTRKPKFALLNQWVAMVNSPTKNLLIDPEGTVSVLVPQAPLHGPSMVAGASTGLTGAYLYKISFMVKNSDGDILLESPLSPASASTTLANQNASLTDIATSPDSIVTTRRLYRTLSGGTAYFHLFDIEDNTTTALIENVADATVALLTAAGSSLVSPPGTLPGIRLKNIIEWRSRFWAVADEPSLVDYIYVTDTNKVYAWPTRLVTPPTGQDEKGIIGFGRRKNQLGFVKRLGVWMVSAPANSTGISTSSMSVTQIGTEEQGGVAEDTILTVGDDVYYLGTQGVFEWSDRGIASITDDSVKPWFSTDTYFNRSRFPNAFARYNRVTNSYELHLANAGDSTENRWVSFNRNTRKWYGPHKTGALTPTHAGHLLDANGLPMTLVGGSDGVIYTGNSANKRDGAATAIDMDCQGPWHIGAGPDNFHTWQQLTMLTKIEAAGTLEITPYTGWLDASAGTAISHDQTLGRELLRRLGNGRLARLRIRKNTVNQSATIYGYELPFFSNGRR